MVKYTDETLKQLHSTILEMLIEFDRICRKYNIPYIIESGTLLGAVRNNGICGRQMIPLIDGYVTEMEMYSVMGFRLEGIVYDIYKHARQDNFWRRLDY